MTDYEKAFWIEYYEKQDKEIKKKRFTKKLTTVVYILAGLVGIVLLFELKVL